MLDDAVRIFGFIFIFFVIFIDGGIFDDSEFFFFVIRKSGFVLGRIVRFLVIVVVFVFIFNNRVVRDGDFFFGAVVIYVYKVFRGIF